MPAPADIQRAGGADSRFPSRRFMNVAAKEMLRLVGLDEVEYGLGAGVEAVADTVKRGAEGRCVTNEHERFEVGEPHEAIVDLRFAILSGRIERGRIRVPETGNMPAPGLKMTTMKIVQAVPRAHRRHLVGRFVISGQDVYAVAAYP